MALMARQTAPCCCTERIPCFDTFTNQWMVTLNNALDYRTNGLYWAVR